MSLRSGAKILGSVVKHGFGLKVVLKFLSVLQLYDFWEAFPDSLSTFLNVYTIVFQLESFFSKQVHHHHVSRKDALI